MAHAARSVYKVIQRQGDWYWLLDTQRDDEGMIGPFSGRAEAEKDAMDTLGFADTEEGRAQVTEYPGYVYLVRADHAEEKYRAVRKPIVVRLNEGGFSAYAFPYGSGVAAPTPKEAIRLLLEHNGCTNVRIEFSPKPEWDEQ
jgi:hypothetical protein